MLRVRCESTNIRKKKMGTKNIIIALSVILISHISCLTSCFAQDIHFSQFNQNPSLINPALVGGSNVARASVIYKDQWKSVTVPYKTFGASVEMRFKHSNWAQVDEPLTLTYKRAFSRTAAGLSFYNDKAGDGNMGTSQVNFSLASYVPLTRNSSIAAGLLASVVQRTIDFSKLIFPEQYNGNNYDPSIYNGENVASQSFIYADFAAGLNWSVGYNARAIGSNDDFKANVGVSVYHINKPEQKFLTGSAENLNRKFVLHGDILKGIPNTKMALAPTYLFQFQGTAKEILFGTMLKYYFREDSKYTGILQKSSVGLGAYYRNNDALILSLLLEYQQYAIGFSYDVNVSRLKTASSGRGGPEIFIRYTSANPFLYQMKTKSRYNLN